MADLRVSQLPELLEDEVQASDPLLISDLSASESKKVTPVALFAASAALVTDGTIPSSKLEYPLPPGVVDGQAIADEQITDAHLVADSLTARVIAPEAIGSSELANGAVDNPAIQPGAVTGGDVNGSIAAGTINDYNVASGGISGESIADAAIQTDHIAPGAVTGGAGGSLADATIEQQNMTLGSVGEPQLIDESCTLSKLASDSVDSSKIVTGAVTPVELQENLPGTILAADTITDREIGPDAIGASEISGAAVDRGLDKATGFIGHSNNISAGVTSGLIYDENGHIIGPSDNGILPTELPIATDSSLGAVIVPADTGLTVDSAGQLDHTDSVGAGIVSGIAFNDTGHITAASPLGPLDLPIATATEVGATKIPGPDIVVDVDGAVTHATSGVTPGAYPKVSVDDKGHVTEGSILDASDIPVLDASIITTGQLPTDRLADRSVTQRKLADYSISFIQEDVPTPDPGGPSYHNGCLWFQESTGQLNMWNGNSWMPVARGALASQNLRWGGSLSAATGLVQFATSFAINLGFKVGEPLLPATNTIGGLYFVISEGGALVDVPEVSGEDFKVGDWCYAVDETVGWQRLDVADGGSQGATILDQLQDVTITTPAEGNLLRYNGSIWVNGMFIDWAGLNAAGDGAIVEHNW